MLSTFNVFIDDFSHFNLKYLSVGDVINSRSKLEREMSTTSSNLDEEDSSAHKGTKHCTS